jgi:hypothetical protein
MNARQVNVSAKMVRRRLKKVAFDQRTPPKVPWLLPYHKITRLQFPQTHADWDEQQWRNVLFTDETRIQL